jgi:hypothetical protein
MSRVRDPGETHKFSAEHRHRLFSDKPHQLRRPLNPDPILKLEPQDCATGRQDLVPDPAPSGDNDSLLASQTVPRISIVCRLLRWLNSSGV